MVQYQTTGAAGNSAEYPPTYSGSGPASQTADNTARDCTNQHGPQKDG
jgi:hypothetical protein